MVLPEFMQRLHDLVKKGRKQKRKTILFSPLDSLGHINSLISIANQLKAQNHRTVFLFIEPLAVKLKEYGHEVYDATSPDLVESKQSDAAQDKWNQIIQECAESWRTRTEIENLEEEMCKGFGQMAEDIKQFNGNIERKLEAIKPDIIIIDHYFGIPALFKNSKVPWVRIFSASPLALHHNPDLPQAWLGLPTNFDKNNLSYIDQNERTVKARKRLYDSYNAYWTSFGYPDLPTNPISYIPTSPYLNIYMYPEEIDYKDYPLKNWKRCDCMVRDLAATGFELPEKLRDKPGKIVFLSLGSMASAEIGLMKRLTSLLADSPHRFIVTKGPLHDKYELPDNMWGDKLVPQLEVLKIADLIITHGGNNTLTESFYYGVPGFIICPLFGDQFDNATRMQEMGLGIRIHPYKCSKEELLDAIEKMLANTDARDRIKAISERMQKNESPKEAVKLICDFVAKH